jgi:hypothetical protein
MGVKLTKLGNNQTEIVTEEATTLYSYETAVVVTTHFAAGATIKRPVVYITNGANEKGKRIRTRTTVRHINSYLADIPENWKRIEVDQEELEGLIG